MAPKTPQQPAHTLLQYVDGLISLAEPPATPREFAKDEELALYREKVLALRGALTALAQGELNEPIKNMGFLTGQCKTLQANLRHLIWQAQQVERGDYTQQIDFMGDFSKSFNNMITQLATTSERLQQKEEALINLAISLQKEVRNHAEQRNTALKELKQSESKFKYQAEHDPLTGVLNRRSFFSLAEAKLRSASSIGLPGCICLLDIDHFKHFNDTHGHIIGDEALKHIVRVSSMCLRNSDSIGRYGGEEFILFFSDAEAQQGAAIAERIRKAIHDSPFLLPNETPVTITASLGLCEMPPKWTATVNTNLLTLLLPLADRELYRAKQGGRNQVKTTSLSAMDL